MIFKVQQVLKIKTNFDLKIGPKPIKMPQYAPLHTGDIKMNKNPHLSLALCFTEVSPASWVLVRGDAAELKRHISVDYFECDVYSNEI